MYPPAEASICQEQSGQLDILRNPIEKTDYSQMYPLAETSSGQVQCYIRSALHFLIWCSAIGEISHTLQCRRY